ncbi:hypothetical protein [Paenibacillus humicola]|uniref:hypothetical protein n=1 Tax=Paenibacillus humicola TaxID=3110540 RepID=UPI00237A2470|nr:hypothetical protein [Paenibacillus humicola]
MSQTIIPRAAVQGTATGVLFMAFFGTLWAGIGVGGLEGWGFAWLLTLSLLIGVALLLAGLLLIRAARGLSNEMTEEDARRERTWRLFGIIFGLEGVFIGAAGAICNAANRFDLFFSVMAIIVGAHFFPLAYLFRVKVHYIAGTLLCLLAVVGLLLVPYDTVLGQHQIEMRSVVVGFGSAIILWGTGASVWMIGRRLLDKARNGSGAGL